jgi:hypothetical protein
MTVAAHIVRLAGALLCCAFAAGAGAEPDAVDRYMQTELAARRIPGAALLVMRGGKIVRMRGYGLANVELEVPVTPDTVFELASITKQFTAAAIMLPATQKIIAERMATLKSFTFIMCDEMSSRVIEHLGERISRVCYYKMTGAETRYYTFWLTADVRVADFYSSLE